MKVLLSLMLTFLLSSCAYAVLTAQKVPVVKIGGSPAELQNGSITDTGTASGAGNVGINQPTPTTTLDVVGTVKATHLVGEGSGITGLSGSGTVTSVGIASSGSTLSVSGSPITGAGTVNVDINPATANTWTGQQIFNSANVGVGSTAPGQALDVQGTVRASNFYNTNVYRWVNVCSEFTVDCTGATNSNTAFQAAATYVHNTPGTGIFIPPGSTILLSNESGQTFTIDPAITAFAYHGGVRLYGGTTIWGYGATINTPTSISNSGAIFFADNTGDTISIYGLTANGHKNTWSDSTNVGFFTAYLVNNITIRDTHIYFFNSRDVGVFGNSSTHVSNIRVEHNLIEEDGKALGDYQHHTTDSYGNESDNVSSLYSAEPIYFWYVDKFTLDYNQFKRSWADAMEVINSTNGSISFNEISNSKMGSIFITGTDNISIIGNRIWADQTDYSDTAIWTHSLTTGSGLDDISIKGYYPFYPATTYLVKVTVTGATDKFQYSIDGGSTYNGTDISMTTGTAVTMGNLIKVQFAAKTGHTLNNVWTLTPVGYSRGSRAITIEDGCTYTLVQGNEVWNVGREGLLHFKSTYTKIIGNYFDRNGRKAYSPNTYQQFLQGSKDNINISDNATSSATYLDEIQIEDNTLSADSSNRMSLRISGSARNVTVKNNHFIQNGSASSIVEFRLDDRFYSPSTGHWYRCILDHAPLATNEPGVGVNTATYWVLDDTNRTVSDATPSQTWELSAPATSSPSPYYRAANGNVNNPIIFGNTGTGSGNTAYTSTGDQAYGRFFVNPVSGNVGIGSFTPGKQLDVQGTVRATYFSGDGSGLTGVLSSQWTTVTNGLNFTPGNVGIGSATPGTSLDVQGTLRSLGITQTGTSANSLGGNTGIGTATPGTALDVQGTVRGTAFQSTGSGVSYFNTGNLGIGTTNPGTLLDISGGRIRQVGIGTTVPQGLCMKADGTIGYYATASFAGTCN